MTVEQWLGKDNQLGIDIYEKKYRYNNETFEEWLDRVSNGDEEVKRIILEKKFLFGGRTLSNRGTGKVSSFSNCYSRGFVEDDLNDIMQANTDIAITFKAQGGQGISLSKLRPKGCGINHGQFQSDGIIPFMEIYNRTTESISQGGSRKGALILSLDIWHKEAQDFITIKSEQGRIQKANLSLEIDDEFMDCVDKYYSTGEIVKKTIKTSYGDNYVEYEVIPINLYKKMMETAHVWAEPGCIFTNRFRNYNLMQYCDDYQIETCNPCGEQPLPKHGACNLGSINLSEFVCSPFTDKAYFDVTDFIKTVHIAVKALDEVIDENMDNHALKEQKEMAKNYRNIGLGIMGLHDALIKLGKTYGSEDSIQFVDNIMEIMFKASVIASVNLAKDKGCFPKYNKNFLKSDILNYHFTAEELTQIGIEEYGIRNCSLLSIAPTGSLGTMLNVSTGCEPLFALYYNRKTESLNSGEDKYYKVYSGVVADYVNQFGETLPNYFVSSKDIKWKDRVDMQSALQKHVDTAISSTINLPNEITVDEIELLYLYAWKQGLKGITIFRDGCKRAGILSTNDTNNNTEDDVSNANYPNPTELKRGEWRRMAPDTKYYKRKIKIGCGKLNLFIGWSDSEQSVQELWVKRTGQGGCEMNIQASVIAMSGMLRLGGNIFNIEKAFEGLGACNSFVSARGKGSQLSKGSSCATAILNEIKEFLSEKQAEANTLHSALSHAETSKTDSENKTNNNKIQENNVTTYKCPECGEPISFEGGCMICKSCGYSKCD